jgi:hypothetical protein
MFKNPVNLEMLSESKVKAILERDESAARKAGKSSFWKTFNENLQTAIPDAEYRNTVFLHAVKSLQYATKNQPLTEATTSASVATYNKAMLPTIITRVFPQIVVTKFIATRQLDVPTQVIQTFRLSRNTTKGGTNAGAEYMNPAGYKRYGNGGAQQYEDTSSMIDPFYSSQQVTEVAGTAAVSGYTPTYTPYINATATVSVYDSSNPRNSAVVAIDNGAGVLTSAVVGVSNGTITVSGAGIPSLTLATSASAAATAAVSAGAMAAVTGTATYNVTYQYNQERNKALGEVSFVQSLIQVSTRSRKNFAQISAEAIQDLEAYTEGRMDALKELVSGMTESMALEIDLEMMMDMMANAGKVSTYDASYPSNQFRGTMFQKNQELVHKMNYLANDMSIDFLRGEGMFAVTHPHVFTLLQNTAEFKMEDFGHKAQGEGSVGGEKFGTVNNFTVAKAPQFPQSDKILMGFTSKDLGKAPYAYFPFVTYLTPPSVDVLSGDIFSTVVGLQQRYDHQVLLDGSYGLGVLQVQNLYTSGSTPASDYGVV